MYDDDFLHDNDDYCGAGFTPKYVKKYLRKSNVDSIPAAEPQIIEEENDVKTYRFVNNTKGLGSELIQAGKEVLKEEAVMELPKLANWLKEGAYDVDAPPIIRFIKGGSALFLKIGIKMIEK